jgi:hypothetical protein
MPLNWRFTVGAKDCGSLVSQGPIFRSGPMVFWRHPGFSWGYCSAVTRDGWRDRVALFLRCLGRGQLGEFLEARIIPQLIEHWIEPEQRGSERLSYCAVVRYRNSFRKAAMARSDSPVTTATRAKISRRFGPSIAFFSNRPGASGSLTRQAVFQNRCE